MPGQILRYFSQPTGSEQMDGTNMKNVEIFRVGSFHGGRHTFNKKDLKEMVKNFHYMKVEGILPNVPVRADHPGFLSGGSVDKIIGYFTDLRLRGEKLVADFQITEPDAQEKIKRGTYRSRSVEIGSYEDNSGDVYEPSIMGVAFVDLPAVEGLDNNFVVDFSQNYENKELVDLNYEEFAKWTRAFIDTLPNSSFAAIEPDYLSGKTKDKNARHLPFKDASGKVDLPHLRNALARVNQVIPVTSSISAKELRAKALATLNKHKKLLKGGDEEDESSNDVLAEWDKQVHDIMQFNKLTDEEMKKFSDEKPVEGIVPPAPAPTGEAAVEVNGTATPATPTEPVTPPEPAPAAPVEGTPAPDGKGTPEPEPPVVAPVEAPAPVEGATPEPAKEMAVKQETVTLSKTDYDEFMEAKKKVISLELDAKISVYSTQGKTTPGMKEAEKAFLLSLSADQVKLYEALKALQPKFLKFDGDVETPSVAPKASSEATKDEAIKEADAFLERTGGVPNQQ